MKEYCSDFHLIHDSFGVPIGHIELLNKSIRESFIELFESKPLELFIKQVDKESLPLVEGVMLNTLNLKEVANSRYIFS
jgi:hypothetical protein